MKHATEPALDKLEPLLQRVRKYAALKEKGRGVFYCKSKAFLHFHEDAAGLFADLKVAESWRRYPVNSSNDYEELMNAVAKELAG